MARIFKRGDVWWMDYRDHTGARVRQAASTDKSVAQKLLGDALTAAARMRGGMTHADPNELRRPFSEHRTDYTNDLTRSGRAPRYVYLVGNRLDRAAKHAGWRTLADVSPRTITDFLASLAEQKRSPKTINEARGDLHAFLGWCVKQRRMEGNPCAQVGKTDSKRDKTRRALSVPECKALLAAVPPRRKLLYMTLIYTGLRRSEARSLTWANVRLDGLNPCIDLPPSITKSGKAERIPLVQTVADALLLARGEAGDGTKVFARGMPKMRTFYKDLEAAKIPKVDERGRKVVLHSLRHSLCTMLAASNVPMAMAQRIMRHRDIRLTAETYCDEGLLPLSEAMRSLPSLGDGSESDSNAQQELAKTGTDDAVPDFVPSSWHNGSKTSNLRLAGSPPTASQSPVASRVGNNGPKAGNCGRQESNLHGLAATRS